MTDILDRPTGSAPAGGNDTPPGRDPGARRKALLGNQLLWPTLALVALLLLNLAANHSFFDIRIQDGHLFGSLVDIVRNSAPEIGRAHV